MIFSIDKKSKFVFIFVEKEALHQILFNGFLIFTSSKKEIEEKQT
jgi:hypothetical protein